MKVLLPTLIFFSFLAQVVGGSFQQEKLETIIKDSCPESLSESYVRKFQSVIPRLKAGLPVEEALRATLPTSCFLGYPPWKASMAFNLGLVGIHNRFSQSAIAGLTELLSVRTFGKKKYEGMGKLWEKMAKTGESDESIGLILAAGLSSGYTVEAMEILAVAYFQIRQEESSLSPENALKKALEKTKRYRSERNPEKIKTLLAEIRGGSKNTKLAERGVSTEKTADEIWDELEAVVNHQRPVIPVIPPKGVWDTNKLNKTVDAWVGVPYRYGGDSRRGIDCSAFVLRVIRSQFSVKNMPRSASGLSKLGKPVSKDQLLPGDLLFFAASSIPNKVTHTGIYLGGGIFAHASSSRGVIRSSLDQRYYKKRFVKARRLF